MNIVELNKHWLLLHNSEPNLVWFNNWVDTIPCPECKQHFKLLLKFCEPTPHLISKEAWFKYGVYLHNEVNKRLNKPYYPLYEAVRRYMPVISTCMNREKDAIGEVSCGCAGPQKIYNCNLLKMECMIEAKKTQHVEYYDGRKENEFKGIQCQGCNHYTPLLGDFTDDWRFIKTEELLTATKKLAGTLPPVSCIIAAPTSGLLPATYLSTTLHVPLYPSIVAYNASEPSSFSVRSKRRKEQPGVPLLVDDTCYAGNTFKDLSPEIKRAAVYCLPSSRSKVDYFGELLQCPHLLEWNLFNSTIIEGKYRNKAFSGGIAVDLDGVLCYDPPVVYDENINDRIKRYEEWLPEAKPLYPIRACKVPLIVTWRIERYREATEKWLEKHGIKFDKLIMWQGDAPSRHWKPDYKGQAYLDSGCSLFIESNEMQAHQIHKYTKKPVLSIASGRIYK